MFALIDIYGVFSVCILQIEKNGGLISRFLNSIINLPDIVMLSNVTYGANPNIYDLICSGISDFQYISHNISRESPREPEFMNIMFGEVRRFGSMISML